MLQTTERGVTTTQVWLCLACDSEPGAASARAVRHLRGRLDVPLTPAWEAGTRWNSVHFKEVSESYQEKHIISLHLVLPL